MTIVLIVLVLMLVGAVPAWPHSRGWGYGPSGGLGLLVLVLIVLLLMGRWARAVTVQCAWLSGRAVAASAGQPTLSAPHRWPRRSVPP